jgi:hypothetical protein
MIGFLSLRGWIFGSILTLGLTGPILAQDLDCSNVQTQTDMNFCAKQDWQDADDALNDIYKAAISQMKLTDSVLDAEDAGAVEALNGRGISFYRRVNSADDLLELSGAPDMGPG